MVCIEASCLLAAAAYSVAVLYMLLIILVRPAPCCSRPRSDENLKSSSEKPFFASGSRGPPPPPLKPCESEEVPEYLFLLVRALSRSEVSCSLLFSSSTMIRAFSRTLTPQSLPSGSTNSNFCSFFRSRRWSRASSMTRSEPCRSRYSSRFSVL